MGITRTTQMLAAAGTVAILTATLSACAGTGSTTGTTDSKSDAAASSTDAELDAFAKPLEAYPVPTEPIEDVASVKGKTIHYVPITLQAPQFTITLNALKAAASTVGISVQVCDGKGSPEAVSACVERAAAAKAGAVIVDAIPYVLAANALDAAQKAGVAVVNANQVPLEGHPASATLGYVGANAGSDMEEALARFVVADSGGKAHVLENLNADGPSPAIFQSAGQKVYDGSCSDCKVAINKVSSGSFNLVGASTSAALLKDPSINYVHSQYEQFLHPTASGIQETGRTGIKVVTGAAQMSALTEVQGGQIVAASSQAAAYEGWAELDAALRLILEQPLPDYVVPVRLFTKDTMADVKVTEEAEATGEWYGPATFTDEYQKLWGLS